MDRWTKIKRVSKASERKTRVPRITLGDASRKAISSGRDFRPLFLFARLSLTWWRFFRLALSQERVEFARHFRLNEKYSLFALADSVKVGMSSEIDCRKFQRVVKLRSRPGTRVFGASQLGLVAKRGKQVNLCDALMTPFDDSFRAVSCAAFVALRRRFVCREPGPWQTFVRQHSP